MDHEHEQNRLAVLGKQIADLTRVQNDVEALRASLRKVNALTPGKNRAFNEQLILVLEKKLALWRELGRESFAQ